MSTIGTSGIRWEYSCDVCDFRGDPETSRWICPDCHGSLGISWSTQVEKVTTKPGHGLWQFADLLPASPPDSGSLLGEGNTPLVRVEIDDHPVFFKLDSQLPTGSFKDRGAAVLASYLKSVGVRRIIVDSSGNAAAAMSAFAAALGLECTVFVPASASAAKLVQARACGAEVIPVDGSREDVTSAAQQAATSDKTADYASHNYHPVFVEGVKTWALEVRQQLQDHSPDVVFVPCGGGSALVGAWLGFQSSEVPVPRLVTCQPSACSPVVHAFRRGVEIEPVLAGETIAEGTRIAMPARPSQIMNAIRESDGWATAVEDAFLIDTLKLLWSKGLYVEPTAALSVAACRIAIRDGSISADQTIVCHITGHGLKSSAIAESLLG